MFNLYPRERADFWLRYQGKRGTTTSGWRRETVLVEIDPKDYEVAVAQAQANLANAGGHGAIAEYHRADHFDKHFEPAEIHRGPDIENTKAGVIAAEKAVDRGARAVGTSGGRMT